MRIDVHSHFVPRSVARAADAGADWHGAMMSRTDAGVITGCVQGVEFDLPDWSVERESVGRRLERLDAMRLDAQVLSIAPRLHRYGVDAASAVPAAREMNDDLLEMISAAPGRLRGFAHLPLQDPAAAVVELERMVAQPGILGAAVGTNVDGAPWDAPELFPVLQAAQDLGAMLFIHPANRPADPRMRRHHLKNLVGNPLETTLAIAALIFGGVLDRLPGARLCFAHAGGFAALGVGRFDAGYEARADVRAGAALPPSEYLRRLHFDSITFSERALRHLVDVVGPSQVLLGSDYPADMGTADPVGFLEGCGSLSESERSAILGGNFERLFGPSG